MIPSMETRVFFALGAKETHSRGLQHYRQSRLVQLDDDARVSLVDGVASLKFAGGIEHHLLMLQLAFELFPFGAEFDIFGF